MYNDVSGLALGGGPGGRRVAVVGSGVAGLGAAHAPRHRADVTPFEAAEGFGGHAHTVDVTLRDRDGAEQTFGVDTGFLVLNERTYPQLLALFSELGVAIAPSDMSFSVQAPGAGLGGGTLEWSGSNLGTLFAQPSNLVRPRFWGMLLEIVRFNRLCTRLAAERLDDAACQDMEEPLEQFLKRNGFSAAFRDWYLLPMLGCIWSCPTDQMLRFPVVTMVRFCHNHGLIQIENRPQWYTVPGGSRNYVERLIARLSDVRLRTPVRRILRTPGSVTLVTDQGAERFDAVVLACHTDQALRLLGAGATESERSVLGAIRYQPNRAVLHTDASVMPKSGKAWAAWNYVRASDREQDASRVSLHYWINRLQPLPVEQPVIVSLNPLESIDPSLVLGEWTYDHPVFDLGAIRAQAQIEAIQGTEQTWYAGAWCGYGFHEDGLKSGQQVAGQMANHPGLARHFRGSAKAVAGEA